MVEAKNEPRCVAKEKKHHNRATNSGKVEVYCSPRNDDQSKQKVNKSWQESIDSEFLDALASLAFKLRVSE